MVPFIQMQMNIDNTTQVLESDFESSAAQSMKCVANVCMGRERVG